MMFYGAVMSTFMTAAVPPTVIQTVLTAMVHGIAHSHRRVTPTIKNR